MAEQESGFKWEVEPGLAFDQLFEAYSKTLFQSGARIAERRSEEMLAWAKDNAPWTDRSGDARRLLWVDPEQNAHIVASIKIGHGVDHGLWLEIAYGGRWAIITKVIDHWGPIVWRDMQNMMNLKLIGT